MVERLSGKILALVGAVVIGCGSITGGASGAGSTGRAGGDVFLTADQNFGVQGSGQADGAQGALTSPIDGPALQP